MNYVTIIAVYFLKIAVTVFHRTKWSSSRTGVNMTDPSCGYSFFFFSFGPASNVSKLTHYGVV